MGDPNPKPDSPTTPGETNDELQSRLQMVAAQLRERGIHDERVLAAMTRVRRHEFVPPHLRGASYSDSALPISCEQTISQPYTVAFMCQAAELTGGERALEIGTGSGYGAAVLAELVDEVHTIERIPDLAENARATLARLGCTNVTVHLANGTLGYPEAAPYDAIVVTAGAEYLPKAYLEQIVDGGRIIIPVGHRRQGQTMFRFTVNDQRVSVEDLGGFAFVPLIGEDDGQ